MIYYWTDARQNGIYLCYILKETIYYRKITFNLKWFSRTRKPALAHFGKHENRKLMYNLLPKQNEAISLAAMLCKELGWYRKMTPLLNWLASREMKTYSESRIELRNLQNLKKKCWKYQVSFCHQSSPVSQKTWTLPWILKKSFVKLAVAVNTGGYSIRVLNERSVREVGNSVCPLPFVILNSV